MSEPSSSPDAGSPARPAHSDVDPAVLAGEPGSARQLEGDDDDLALAQQSEEYAETDRIVDANPTALGE